MDGGGGTTDSIVLLGVVDLAVSRVSQTGVSACVGSFLHLPLSAGSLRLID